MSEKRRRKRIRIEGYVAVLFCTGIALLVVGNLLMPAKEFSAQENRALAQRPVFSWSSIQSGAYMKQYEAYQADQFIGRNMWRKLKVSVSRLGGSKEESGVYIGKQDCLMEELVVPKWENVYTNLKAIQSFAKANPDIPVSMTLVPDAAAVWNDKLPRLAAPENQRADIARVKKQVQDEVAWIDADKAMDTHREEDIYYKTDHHWTTLGAYYVFQASGKALQIQSDSAAGFMPYAVSTEFNGALSAKSGCAGDVKEEIDIYVPREEGLEVVVNYVNDQKKTTSLYDSSKLAEKDKYGVFVGGNSSLIDIKTTTNSNRRLLIIKDSYANCFVPFMVPYFREIVLVDPRYYTGNIDEVMTNYNITDALVLYNANTFFEDNNLSGVLTNG